MSRSIQYDTMELASAYDQATLDIQTGALPTLLTEQITQLQGGATIVEWLKRAAPKTRTTL